MATVYEKMTAIGDAIRAKTGGTEALTLDGMAAAITGIKSGGGFPNGTEWTKASSAPTGIINIYKIAYGAGTWVACTDNGIYYSNESDRETWQKANIDLTNADGTGILYPDVLYADGVWVACSYGELSECGLLLSWDGIEWYTCAMDITSCRSITYSNGIWIACTLDEGLWYADYPSSVWSPTSIDTGNFDWVAHGYNIWIAYSGDESSLYYSWDGIEWEQNNIMLSSIFNYTTYSNGIWVACIEGGLAYSGDGINWGMSNITTGTFYYAVEANGKWIACSDSGLYYSSDGKNWTQSNITTNSFGLNSIANANGNWVAGGTAGLYYSSDGENWTQSNIIRSASYRVANANGLWVASGWQSEGFYYSVGWESN